MWLCPDVVTHWSSALGAFVGFWFPGVFVVGIFISDITGKVTEHIGH